jgi:ribosome-binding protein aMBF1 (putative translation factor)
VGNVQGKAVSGPRCVFCGSVENIGMLYIKGTSLQVCDRCAPPRRQYLAVPATEDVLTKKVAASRPTGTELATTS